MDRAIDISHYQGTYSSNTPPNWAGAVLDGVKIGITKVTEYRKMDSMFEYNWAGIKRQGLKRGGYHFWHVSDSQIEQDLFCRTLLGNNPSDAPEIAPILDFEPDLATYTTRIPLVDVKVKSWLDRVELNTGRKPIIYSGLPYWNKHFPTAPAWLGDYDLWLAAYPTDISTTKDQWDLSGYSYQKPRLPIGWTYDKLKFWQFRGNGVVTGFAGSTVDLNYYYQNGFSNG